MKRILSIKAESDDGAVMEAKLHQKTIKETNGCVLDLLPMSTVMEISDMVNRVIVKRTNPNPEIAEKYGETVDRLSGGEK